MPADAETISAVHELNERLASRIEKKISEVARNGDETSRRVHERINAVAKEQSDRMERHEHAEGEVMRELTASLRGLQTEITAHSELIREGKDDRKGLWKWIVGASVASGGAGGFLSKLFGTGGGPAGPS